MTLKDLSKETVILRETGTYTRTVLDRAFEDAEIQPKQFMEIGDWESAREVAAAGLGVSVMSMTDSGKSTRIKRIPLVRPKLEVAEYLVFYPDRRRYPTVRAFLDLVGEVLGT